MKTFRNYLAEATTWQEIYNLNKDVIGANPNLIKPGQQLKMPDGTTYTVVLGDNLSKIASRSQGAKPAQNVAAPGQPPHTAAKPELGTVAGATQAIPTGPTATGAINNGSGVGKSATLDPEQASAAKDAMADPAVSARDKAFLGAMQQNTNPTATPPAPAPAAPASIKAQRQLARQQMPQPVSESLERIILLSKLNG